MSIAHPHKELRFTRAAQARPFWVLAAVAAAAALTLALVAPYRAANPALPHPGWIALPLALTWAGLRLALHCTRRAYLILSPLGLEIFPFWRPGANFRLVPWSDIDAFEIRDRTLTLHFDADRRAGIHLSLAPIPRDRQPLLERALAGRVPAEAPAGGTDPRP